MRTNLKHQIENFLVSENIWHVFFLIIIILVSIIGIFYMAYSFNAFQFYTLKEESAKTIIDQRIANLAAIIAMSIAIFGFLVSNLPIKEPVSYRLLFKKTILYPILFFTLSLISTLMVISLLRDTITVDHMYSRLIVAGTYITIFVLFLIAFVFWRIRIFTNTAKLHTLFESELRKEAQEHAMNILIKRYSEEEYMRFMILMGAQLPYAPINNFQDKKMRMVYDIDLYSLAIFVSIKKRNNPTVYFNQFSLNNPTYETDNFVWGSQNENSASDKKILSKALRLRPFKSYSNNSDIKIFFLDKIEEYSKKNEDKNLRTYLVSLINIYELEMELVK